MINIKYTDFTLHRRILHHVRPYWSRMTGILMLRLLSIPLALLTPLPLKIVVDNVIGSHQLPTFLYVLLPAAVSSSDTAVLILAIGLMLGIALLGYLQGLGIWLLETYTGEKMVLSLRAQLVHHVQRLSLSYHDSKGTYDSTHRIQYDAPCIRYIPIHWINLAIAGLNLSVMIYITARIDRQLALVALAVSPILVLVTQVFSRLIRSQWSKIIEIQSLATAVVQETLAALRVVKAFGQEDLQKRQFLNRSEKSVQRQIRLALLNGEFNLLIGMIITAGTAATIFIGVQHVQSGDLTLGNLLVVIAYLAQLYGPLQTISTSKADTQSFLASAERVFTLLDEAQDVFEKPNARALPRASGAVTFYNVSFAYNNGHPALHNISFDIAPGTRVGVMGVTGAGKTTLISLLTRFYDPTAGKILLDGIDICDYRLADLRNQFAIVLQEPVLFSTSIAQNIAYSRPDAADHDIVEAAKAANAHEFIARLPQGYKTEVGERGMSLSGGERQRISLARAFLKDAPILILDEPTSSVDIKTEAAIVEVMERLMYGRTTFIISHRLSTLKDCDMVLEIENGHLASLTPAIAKAS